MDSDHLPISVEDGAARATRIGGCTVVDQAFVSVDVEQQAVVQRNLETATP